MPRPSITRIAIFIAIFLSVSALASFAVLESSRNALLRYENIQKNTYIIDLKASIEELKSQNKQMQAEVDAVKSEALEKFTSTAQIKAENEEFKKKVVELQDLIAKEKSLARTHSEESNRLRENIAALKKEIAGYSQNKKKAELKAVKIKKELIELHKNLGHIKEARALKDKRESYLYYNLGVSYIWAKRYKLAEGALLTATRLYDKNIDAWYNLALLYEEGLNEPKKARHCYEKYLKLTPDAEDIYDIQWRLMALGA